MLIQIIKGHETPEIRNFSSNGKDITVFEQTAYMHKGGAFPEPFKIGHGSAAEVLPVGDYNLCPSSFVTDNFGGLTLSKYDKKFVSVEPQLKKDFEQSSKPLAKEKEDGSRLKT